MQRQPPRFLGIGSGVVDISRITTLLFDLDETLVHAPDDGDQRLAAAFQEADVEPFFDLGDFRRMIPDIPGESPLDLRRKAFRQIAREKDRDTEDAVRVARAFEMPTPPEFTPVPAATTVLETLRDRGYTVGLVTNGPEAKQRAKLALLELESAFETMVFGDPERGLKPAAAPFETALADLDADPDETVKIGDSLPIDIEPATRLGMHAIWFPNEPGDQRGSNPADGVITELATLLEEPWD